jgi:hypothetical protein
MDQAVHVILEPSHITPVWYLDSIKSLHDAVAKKHITLYDQTDAAAVPDGTAAAIVISTSVSWTHNTINLLRQKQIRPILIGTVPQSFGPDISGTIFDRRAGVEELVLCFHQTGHNRIALVGVNPVSSNDLVKQDAFLSATRYCGIPAAQGDIYPVERDLTDAISAYLQSPKKYDGAICANDYVAVTLLAETRRRNIRVPDEMFVAGFGNHLLGRCSSPTLTTATMDYSEMGIQALTIWEALCANPRITTIIITIKHQVIYRESTGLWVPPESLSMYTTPAIDQTALLPGPGTVNFEVRSLEQCLRLCDQLDYKIIYQLLSGSSYENIGFNLYLSRSALRRRLMKIYDLVNVRSRGDFEALMHKYVTNFERLMQSVAAEEDAGLK